MRIASILHTSGLLLLCLAGTMLPPLLIALLFRGPDTTAFLFSLIVTAASGGLCLILVPRQIEIGHREGFAVVTGGWILFAAFGGLPFYLSGALPSFTDAYFEAMSGFTTTGATVLTDIEGQPLALHFWRSFIQWLGGMGIIVLSLAILPMLGVGGMHLYKAEVPGPVPDRLVPRIRQTARFLWVIYVLLSAIEVLLLFFFGMPFFEALLHTFTTMATGGFSPKSASIGAYQSAAIETVIILFMFIAGANFALHSQALRGNFRVYRDPEFRFYALTVLLTILVMTLVLWGQVYADLASALRYGAFQVVSIVTTTGFGTADYETWPTFARLLLLSLMFFGGCAGSTGGAIKHIRLLLLLKSGYHHLYNLIHPKAIRHVKSGGKTISPEILEGVQVFFLVYLLTFLTATALLTLLEMDLISAMGAVASSLGNVGPGLGIVGPTNNYAAVPFLGKWILSVCMLLGRLELLTVFVLFTPGIWRKSF